MTITDDALGQLLDDSHQPQRRHLAGRRSWLIAAAVVGVLLIVVAFVVGGGSSSTKSSPANIFGGERSGAAKAQVPSPVSLAPAGEGAGSSAATSGGGAGVTNGAAAQTAPSTVPADVPDRVVKTGEMDLEVAAGLVPNTMDRLFAIAVLKRGFVAESHSSEGAVPSGSVTLRVPVQSFDDTIAAVRRLSAKVVSQETAGQDVTSKYVDLQARIHSLAATRASFERLLSRATTIGETLEVQSQITTVQTQIEQLQGQLRVLSDQTTYGTLTVTVAEKGKSAVVPHHASGMSRAFHRSVNRFVSGIEAIVGIIGPVLLVALLAALAWLVARFTYRRVVAARQPNAG